MDGRRIRTLIYSALAVGGLTATGCRTAKQPLPAATLPVPGQHHSGFLGMGRSSPKFGPPPEQVTVAKPLRKPGTGMKVETEVIWADTQVESALLDGQPDDVRNKLLDDARGKYQRALAADPKNKAALVGLGRLYAKAGDRERSVQTYTQALHLDPKDHETAMKLAQAQAQFTDWGGACQSCEYALALDPENRGYRKTYGFCLANAEKWEDAFTALMHKNVMSEADARYFLGRVLFDKDRLPDGHAQLELALKADPTHAEARAVLDEMANPDPNPVTADPNPIRTTGGYGAR
jgi:tetratricopeptide (TPR) repeat protein